MMPINNIATVFGPNFMSAKQVCHVFCACVLLSALTPFLQGADVDSLISLTSSIQAITVTLIEHATDLFTNLEVRMCVLLRSYTNLTISPSVN